MSSQDEINEIPTAKLFLTIRAVPKANGEDDELFDRVSESDLIEFARMHVEAALKAVAEKTDTSKKYLNSKSYLAIEESKRKHLILNAYSNENIK